MKVHSYKKEGIELVRFNANIPRSYSDRFKKIAEELDTTMSDLLMRFVDNFERFRQDNE